MVFVSCHYVRLRRGLWIYYNASEFKLGLRQTGPRARTSPVRANALACSVGCRLLRRRPPSAGSTAEVCGLDKLSCKSLLNCFYVWGMTATAKDTTLYKISPHGALRIVNCRSKTIMSGSCRFRISHSGELSTITKSTPDTVADASPKPARVYRLNRRKVRDRCRALFRLEKSRKFLAFYSISFPRGFPDDDCYQVFNTWLTRMRKVKPKFTYIWVAERQGNGTLHYHLLTYDYVNIRIANYFCGKAIHNVARSKKIAVGNFSVNNYNGVDVRRLRKRKHIVQYITKYVTKNDTVSRRLVWNCSQNISRLFISTHIDLDEWLSIQDRLNHEFHREKALPHRDYSILVDFYSWSKSPPRHLFSTMDSLNEMIANYELS